MNSAEILRRIVLIEIPMVNWPQEGNHTRLKPFDEERFEYAITEGRT